MSKRFAVVSLLLLLSSAFVVSTAIAEPSLAAVSVPAKKQGGTYVVPVLINGAITLDFVVDSGAADVSIPADVVLTLIRTGTIQEADFVGTQTYVLADGSKVPSQISGRLDVAAVKQHLGDSWRRFEVATVSTVIRIKAVQRLAQAA